METSGIMISVYDLAWKMGGEVACHIASKYKVELSVSVSVPRLEKEPYYKIKFCHNCHTLHTALIPIWGDIWTIGDTVKEEAQKSRAELNRHFMPH
jgi:hypothetical protein